MPPKPKVTKEQIESAALELVRAGGEAALTAKALAARLGCSTQPVFWHFRTMEELRGAVFGRSLAVFGGALRRAVPGVSPYLAVGLNYIRFAAEEPALFRLLFMSDFGKTDMVGAKVEMDYILSVIEESDRVTGAAAQVLYREMWLFSHGIAAMVATGTASFSESEVRRMLGDVHRALINELERNDGARTLLVEKHNLPGGFATSFRRGRFEFEASLHELNDFGPADNAGDVRDLFDALGVTDKIDWLQIPEAYRVLSRAEKLDATMPFGVQAFIDKMEQYVPGSRPSVTKFFDLAEEVRLAQAYSSAVNGNTDSKVMVGKYGNFVRAGSYSVNEVLAALKMPKKARDILNAYWCYLGAHCGDLSFVHYASMVNRYIRRGASMPKMRSHEISLALTERIRELGGDVLFNTEAVKILTDERDGGVAGVVLDDGTQIATRHVVANCAPHLVFGKMMDRVPESEIRATNARKFSGRGFTMFLGLDADADELGVQNHNYFLYDTMDTAAQYDRMRTIRDNSVQATVCLNRAYPECSPKGTCMMYFTTLYMSDDWGNVTAEDYFKTKDYVANKMIDRFEQDTGARLRGHIEEISVATPMTYARYCGHPEGVIYGYESQYWDGLMPRLQMMAEDHKVRGLRFAGGYAMRLSGYSSAYFSGDISGRQTVGDIKKEG